MKHSTETANNAVNGDNLRSNTFGRIEKALYGLVCCLSCMVILAASGGCDIGTPYAGGGISNLLQSAPALEEFDENNNYIPYKQTGEMNIPRYLHGGMTHSGGLAYVFGGSDERGLSALDSVEFYDQSTLDEDSPVVESETGVWIDTDIEGNPIAMIEGPRILHTVTELTNGEFIIIGGTDNMSQGAPKAQAEKFDPNTRQSTPIEDPMELPRFRHKVTRLPNGELLITGGQIQVDVVIAIPGQGGQGGGPIDQQEPRFPSTNIVEVFSPNSNEFDILMSRSSAAGEATMAGARGRSGHAVARLAGIDKIYQGGDDIYLLAGGMETLSAVSGFAPGDKFPGAVGRGEADGKTSIEVYDPGVGAFILISSVKLNTPRINTPYAVNLGQFNDWTPDGVQGMGNAILITHGNSDGTCPETPLLDQVFIAYFQAGGGPAGGLRFFEAKDDQYLTQIQHMEYSAGAPLRGDQVARCGTNPVAMPRKVDDAMYPETERQAWVFSLAGSDIFNTPNGCVENLSSSAMLAGCVFDPFFNVGLALGANGSPTDLGSQRRRTGLGGHLGIVGAWFTIDSAVGRTVLDPLADPQLEVFVGTMDFWGSSPPTRWAQNRGRERTYVTCLKIGGVNGIVGDYDDRILLAGGGRSYAAAGGEPASPSAEIFLPPGVSQFNNED